MEQVHGHMELVGCFCVSHPPVEVMIIRGKKGANKSSNKSDVTDPVLQLSTAIPSRSRRNPPRTWDIGAWTGWNQALWHPDKRQLIMKNMNKVSRILSTQKKTIKSSKKSNLTSCADTFEKPVVLQLSLPQ